MLLKALRDREVIRLKQESPEELEGKGNQPWVLGLIVLALGLLGLVDGYYHLAHFVSFPSGDDFAFLTNHSLKEAIPDMDWIFSQWGDRRYVLVRLLWWVGYQFGVRSLDPLVVLSFIFFLGTITNLALLIKRPLGLLFLIPLFSPILFELHTWPILISTTMGYFFLTLAAVFAQSNFIVFSTISLLLGMASDGMIVAIAPVFALIQAIDSKRFTSAGLVTLISLLFFFSYDKSQSAQQAELTLPWTRDFWIYFSKHLSIGYGILHNQLILIQGFFTIFSFLSLGWMAIRYRRHPTLTALAVAIFAGIVVTALSRGNLIYDGTPAIPSRYFYYSMLFVPVIGAGWISKRSVWPIYALLFLILLRGYWNKWDWSLYEQQASIRMNTINCLIEKTMASEPLICPWYAIGEPAPANQDFTYTIQSAKEYGYDWSNLQIYR